MKRVELNGGDWSKFDSERELITIPVDRKVATVRVFYR